MSRRGFSPRQPLLFDWRAQARCAASRYRIVGEARSFGAGRPLFRALGAPHEVQVTAGGVLRLSLP